MPAADQLLAVIAAITMQPLVAFGTEDPQDRVCAAVGRRAPSPWNTTKTLSPAGYAAGAVRIGRVATASETRLPPVPSKLLR